LLGPLLQLLPAGGPQPQHPRLRVHPQHLQPRLLLLGPLRRPHHPLHGALQVARAVRHPRLDARHGAAHPLPPPGHQHRVRGHVPDPQRVRGRHAGDDGAAGGDGGGPAQRGGGGARARGHVHQHRRGHRAEHLRGDLDEPDAQEDGGVPAGGGEEQGGADLRRHRHAADVPGGQRGARRHHPGVRVRAAAHADCGRVLHAGGAGVRVAVAGYQREEAAPDEGQCFL
ncbi:hypothetical protein SLS57_012505, partial [Botryosphaeria dothidea]